jgi:aerobic carbon-monoxide dehydrogenase medium subunit
MRQFEYIEPSSIAETVALLARYGDRARVLAGGTDVLTALKEGWEHPEWIISLGRISDLATIRYDEREGLRIGALATVRSAETSPTVRSHYPALAAAAGTLASVQIRNLATVAGNLCRAAPSADMAPILVALQADVRLVGPTGERIVALGSFFIGPGRTVLSRDELLTEIRVPPPSPGAGAAYTKHSPRRAMDLAVVGVAVAMTLDGPLCRDARIVLGAVAPTPLRARLAEQSLIGQKATPALAEQVGRLAASEAQPISDVRGSAGYRRAMVALLTKRAVLQAANAAATTQPGNSR